MKKPEPREPFEDVPEDFRNTVASLSREDIRLRIAQVTLDQLELMEAQADDEDFQNLKLEFREAGAVYREGTKANKLKIAYARHVLESKGG